MEKFNKEFIRNILISILLILLLINVFLYSFVSKPIPVQAQLLQHEQTILNKTTQYVTTKPKPKHKLKILFWNAFYGVEDYYTGLGDEYYRRIKCPFICEHTANKDDWNSSDALMFHVNTRYLPLPPGRWPHQIYIYYQKESPVHAHPLDESSDKTFNWSMTYHSQSEIRNPYGRYIRRMKPIPMKSVSLQGKKLVAWLVSNCGTPSQREILFNKLSTYIPTDRYGNCGEHKCTDNILKCYSDVGRDYLFYLAWENTLCDDYITEKAWFALASGIVPIVYGGSDYEKFLPPHSFIDVTSFSSIKDLAEYIQYLKSNITAYREYHRWNEEFEIQDHESGFGWCQLCEMLYSTQGNQTTTNVKISEFWSIEKKCSRKQGDKDRLLSNP